MQCFWLTWMPAFAGMTPMAVHAIVARFGGSISAEHGIGRMKAEALERMKSPVELAMMRRLKDAFDPRGILNPGKSFWRARTYPLLMKIERGSNFLFCRASFRKTASHFPDAL